MGKGAYNNNPADPHDSNDPHNNNMTPAII
jgi:hypothetical protein